MRIFKLTPTPKLVHRRVLGVLMGFLDRLLRAGLALGLFTSINLNEVSSDAALVSKYALDPAMTTAEKVRLAQSFEVIRTKENTFEVLVPQNRTQELRELAPQATLQVMDISETSRRAFRQSRASIFEKPGYHSFEDVQQILKTTSTTFPEITKLVNYGVSPAGRAFTALRVGAHLNQAVAQPRLLLTAATHGDEIITTEVLLSLMNTLITKASSGDPRFVKMIEDHEIVFIPTLNADGFSRQNRYDGMTDPNRSYPYPGHENAKPSPSIAAELQLISEYPIVGSIDFHAASGVVMYPWAYTDQPLDPVSLKIFEELTAAMSATNGYGHGAISDIMYISPGSSADYYFWKYKSISIGIEMGDDKSPDSSEFSRYIHDQEESTWLFIESFPTAKKL